MELLILTSSTAEACLETSEFTSTKVDRELLSSSPEMSSKALMPDPYMVFNFPSISRSSSVAFKVDQKIKTEIGR